jgi:hypothetical protein
VTALLARALRPAAVDGCVWSSGAAAAAEELENTIKPPVVVKLTKLVIDGGFVDAASG